MILTGHFANETMTLFAGKQPPYAILLLSLFNMEKRETERLLNRQNLRFLKQDKGEGVEANVNDEIIFLPSWEEIFRHMPNYRIDPSAGGMQSAR